MRNGRRNILVGIVFLLLTRVGTPVVAARHDAPAAATNVRLTVEVAWSARGPLVARAGVGSSPTDLNPVDLEISEGRVIEAIAWPSGPEPSRPSGTVWRLGGDRSGRVRARLEAPVGASLILRSGGQVMNLPLTVVLDGSPPRTPPQFPVDITVERLPWDVLTVSVGTPQTPQTSPPPPMGNGALPPLPPSRESDGVVPPGATVPVTVGFNIVTPEPTEVGVRCVVEVRPLRGTEPTRRQEVREVVATSAAQPAAFVVPVEMPESEGTYVLELRASWEPLAGHEAGSLLSRILRRGKRVVQVNPVVGSSSASRRVTLVVLGKGPEPSPPNATATAITTAKEREVDALDLGRLRGNRPSAAGRAPAPSAGRASWAVPDGALVEATRRDRLQGWFTRAEAEVSQLGPADSNGLAWSAVGLKVAHPGRPHRLTLTVTGGHPSALGVAVVGPAMAESGLAGRPRLLLDACASGPPILPGGPSTTYSWLVWPDTADPVLVLVNRSGSAPVQVGSVTLTEWDHPPLPPTIEEPAGAPTRAIGVALTGTDVLDRFAAAVAGEPGLADVLTAARNLGWYVAHCGGSAVLLSDRLADRARRRSLEGQAAEDATGPDRLDLASRVLGRRGVSTWLELGLDGALPGLPAPGTPEALARGLARVDRRGLADGPVPAYNPLHPEVGEALKARVVETVAAHKTAGTLAGVVVRLGPGPTLPGSPDTGFDDATFPRFVREAFEGEAAQGLPGLDPSKPERFAERARFLAGSGRTPWLAWRSKRVAALYDAIAAAVRNASAETRLAIVTPGLGESPAGTEARRTDLAGLAPSLAWRAVGLDLDTWPVGEHGPVVLRGVSLGPEELARDLATSPELDAQVAARPARGLLLEGDPGGDDLAGGPRPDGENGLGLVALPLDGGPTGEEPLGHALAALDARWILLAAPAVAGHEEQVRRFARVFRGLPASTGPASAAIPAQGGTAEVLPFGVSARIHRTGGRAYLALANDTPYPVRLDTVLTAPAQATFDDLGRGSRLAPDGDATTRHLVLDLLPFGVAAVRVSTAEVKLGPVTPYPSEAVLTSLQARYDELSETLSRLSRKGASGPAGPPNPGFEPSGAGMIGWRLGPGMGAGNVIRIDPVKPRSGQASLRLDAATPPASAVSDAFAPGVHTTLLVRAWLRSDRPDAKVRLWIEGEAAGKPYQRVSEMVAQPSWSERAVRAGDVPPTGLEATRLRFELVGPGSLWVDDLSITGGALSDPERRNARNALLAAMQAYRDKRYADFARLAGSHWARLPAIGQGAVASALPQGRRLR